MEDNCETSFPEENLTEMEKRNLSSRSSSMNASRNMNLEATSCDYLSHNGKHRSDSPLKKDKEQGKRKRQKAEDAEIKPSTESCHKRKSEGSIIGENAEQIFLDPFCNPSSPKTIHFEDVTSAAFVIKNGILNTPCTRSQLSDICGMEIFLKKDFLQVTGSFKERGARYALMMLSSDQKTKGVISASLGNHALALCYHGKLLNIPVTVVMPVIASIMKIQACLKLGATVITQGNDMGEAKQIALKLAEEEKLVYINGYDHPHIMAGQGTVALEIMEQVHDLDAVVVPVGGGGLIAGVATAVKALKPHVKIIGVETEKCPSFKAAQASGQPTAVPISSTLADGLAVPTVGYNAFVTANKLIDKMIVIGEEWVAIAILRLIEMEKSVVEGAGATGLAAILSGCLDFLKGKKVVVLLCGGNIDTTVLGRCLERGLAADGRLFKFTVCMSDRPGGIAELTRLIADFGVSVKDVMHDRAWLTNDLHSVKVTVICETRDLDHSMQLMELLKKSYERVYFVNIPNPAKKVPENID